MKYLLASAAVALLASGAALAHEGDHDDDKKRDVVVDYDYSGFTAIEVEGVYVLDIRAGDDYSVQTRATRKEADKFEIRLEGDTLVLANDEEKRSKSWKGRNNSGIKVIITMPHLEDLDVAGVASGTVSAFTGGDVDLDVAGVSSLTLEGTCDTLTVDLAGVGEMDAHDLECRHVEADMGGVGELSVYASESVDASAGGMGQIEVHGDPKDRDVSDSFMAKVRFR